MTSESRVFEVEGLGRFEVAPHHCFACGSLNQNGLGLILHVEAGRSWTEVALDQRSQGWDGIAHGGIICTILDEVMAWSLAAGDDWGVTARMQVDFRRPVRIGVPVRADGWIRQARRRVIEAEARLVDTTDGTILATATGTYVAVGEERKRQLRARYGLPLPDGVAS